MQRFFWRACILFLTFCLLGGSRTTYADETDNSPTVRIVTLYGYAPYCFTTPSETSVTEEMITPGRDSRILKGYSWDVVREALHRAGYTINLTVVPWKRAYSGVLHGEYDILFPTTRSDKRLEHFAFGKIAVNDSRALLYLRQDDSLQWRGLDQLPNMEVAVLRGFSYGDAWDSLGPESVHKISVSSIELGFSMLLRGRVRAFAGYEANWDYVARQMNITRAIRKLPVFNEGSEYAVALKTDTYAVKVLQDLGDALKTMREDGTTQQLREKWQLSDRSVPTP